VPTPSQLLNILLLPAFVLVLGAWTAVTLYLLVSGIASGKQALELARGRRLLDEITSRDGDPHDGLVAVIATLPEQVLLMLGGGDDAAAPYARTLAEVVVIRLGREPLEALATTPGTPRQNWRRIAAMRLLARARHPGLVALLTPAIDDQDPEIVGASLALLGRVSDEAAAAALIRALKDGKYTASRVATYLDQSSLPLAGGLRPLLHHPDPQVRYWGATLLARHGAEGTDHDLVALTRDPSPLVRRAAIASLADVGGTQVAEASLRLLSDETWYVRAHAARALASTGAAEHAERIAPLLADREWWVRLAAKESLQRLGEDVWTVLVPYLDHDDAFARNGAAEVLQNIGILDSLIVLEAATTRPSAAKLEMLRKIASAGGTRMTSALLERVDEGTRPRVRSLLQSLGLEPAGVES